MFLQLMLFNCHKIISVVIDINIRNGHVYHECPSTGGPPVGFTDVFNESY